MKHGTFLIGIIFMLFLNACSDNPQKKVVGKWQIEGPDKQVVEFLPDGTFVALMNDPAMPQMPNLTGTWTLLPESRIKIDVNALGFTQTQLGKVSFSSGDLLITKDDGHVDRHIRVK